MKQKCIFIIGPESSGSTLIAKIISAALNGDDGWNGRGFNCCNSASCDSEKYFLLPCREVQHLVCHRSLPFFLNPEWPPIKEWQSAYDARFVICTRDSTIAQRSVSERFERKLEIIQNHQAVARQIISDLLSSNAQNFIWSYETFMFLKEDYLQLLFAFLEIESEFAPESLMDANLKYIKNNSGEKRSKPDKQRLINRFRDSLKNR
tara:strand:+ start:6854 stop:7471 length:618 start_codon:yes stop_codon:yes gene_type:complete